MDRWRYEHWPKLTWMKQTSTANPIAQPQSRLRGKKHFNRLSGARRRQPSSQRPGRLLDNAGTRKTKPAHRKISTTGIYTIPETPPSRQPNSSCFNVRYAIKGNDITASLNTPIWHANCRHERGHFAEIVPSGTKEIERYLFKERAAETTKLSYGG